MKKFTFKSGIHIHNTNRHKSLTKELDPVEIETPEYLYLPLSQHIGAPSKACVSKGDVVERYQLIGEKDGDFSCALHSPVPGTVEDIKDIRSASGEMIPGIILKTSFEDSFYPENNISAAQSIKGEEILSRLKDSGIAGLGGAAFPIHIKYSSNKPVKTVLLNGIECEPYNTADEIIMKNHPDEVVRGLHYLLKSSNCKKGVICIEDNKEAIYNKFASIVETNDLVDVAYFKEQYPQGAEKQLISAYSGKEVPPGKLPIDIGYIVNNVGSARAVCDLIEKNQPLTYTYVTVSGENFKKPQVFRVPFGTPIRNLISKCEPIDINKSFVLGGVMMGTMIQDLDAPVTKGVNAIIGLNKYPSREKYLNCVKCSRCVDHCPAFLAPTTLAKYSKLGYIDEAIEDGLYSCIECGCCSYVCPSNIPLLDMIRHGKIKGRMNK